MSREVAHRKLYVVGAVPRRKFKKVTMPCGCVVMWLERSIAAGVQPACPAHIERTVSHASS